MEAILAEAALANAQLAVAKAVLARLQIPQGASAEEKAVAAQQAQETIEEITTRLTFGQMPDVMRTKNKPQPKISVIYFRDLFGGTSDEGGGPIPLPPDQAVQLAMFAF